MRISATVLCELVGNSWHRHYYCRGGKAGLAHLNCCTSNVQSSRMTTVPPTCDASSG